MLKCVQSIATNCIRSNTIYEMLMHRQQNQKNIGITVKFNVKISVDVCIVHNNKFVGGIATGRPVLSTDQTSTQSMVLTGNSSEIWYKYHSCCIPKFHCYPCHYQYIQYRSTTYRAHKGQRILALNYHPNTSLIFTFLQFESIGQAQPNPKMSSDQS